MVISAPASVVRKVNVNRETQQTLQKTIAQEIANFLPTLNNVNIPDKQTQKQLQESTCAQITHIMLW